MEREITINEVSHKSARRQLNKQSRLTPTGMVNRSSDGLPLGNDVSAADDVVGCSDGWPLGIDVGTASDKVGCNVSTKIPLYLMSSSHNYAIKKNDQERDNIVANSPQDTTEISWAKPLTFHKISMSNCNARIKI